MVEVGQDPGRTLDPHERFDLEACLDHFVWHFFREVDVGGREPLGSSGRVAMLPFADIALDDLFEPGVFQEASEQTVIGGGEARDRRRGDHASGANDTVGLPACRGGSTTRWRRSFPAPLGCRRLILTHMSEDMLRRLGDVEVEWAKDDKLLAL
jgi:hypothetical protein